MKLLTATLLVVLTLTACGGIAPTSETKPAQPEQAVSATGAVEPTTAVTVESATSEPLIETTSESMAATEEAPAAMPEESEAAVETVAADTPAQTAESPEAMPAAEVDWLTSEGKTAENLAYLGNPEATITIIDYSDFL